MDRKQGGSPGEKGKTAMRRRHTAVRLLAPGQKKLLPPRPMPLPPPALVTKEPTSTNEWDILTICILEDWKWQLTFEQLVTVVKREGPSYGFSTSSWASDRIEIEVGRSVKRLEMAKQLRIGKDRNTLLPAKARGKTKSAKSTVIPKPPATAENPPEPDDERTEIRSKDDWRWAALEVIEQADGSITQSDIFDKVWNNELTDWRLPQEISAEDIERNVGLAIVALAEDKAIAADDEVEATNEEDVQWRIA